MITFLWGSTQNIWSTFAAALLHSIWQGVVMAFLLYLYLRIKPADKTELRYRVSLGMLFMVLLSFMITWILLCTAGKITPVNLMMPPEHSVSSNVVMQSSLKATQDQSPAVSIAQAVDSMKLPSTKPMQWIFWFLITWWIGCMIMTIRLIWALTGQQRLCQTSQPLTDGRILQFLETVMQRTGVSHTIQVLTHDGIDSPIVFGILRPTLVLPLSLVTGAPMPFIEAILAHELAHIHRRDYLINLLQMGMEAVFFFNPAVLWINRQIRLERETCCDLWAIRYTGERMTYVNAMAFVLNQQRSLDISSVMAPAFIQRGKSFFTMERFKRIAQPWHYPVPQVSKKSAGVLLVVGVVLVFLVSRMTDTLAEEAKKWFVTGEQINKMAETDKKWGAVIEALNYKEKRIKITGKIKTQDGLPLPADSSISIVSQCINSISTTDGFKPSPDGVFSVENVFGRIYVSAAAAGYATAVTGPINATAGEPVNGIELILSRGETSTIKIVATSGNPIPKANVSWYTIINESQCGNKVAVQSDSAGIVKLDHYDGLPASICIQADGYQKSGKVLTLKPKEILQWILSPAKLTSGIVLSKETGKPVPGAKIKVMFEGGEPVYDIPDYDHLMTETNDKGEFTLSQLKDGCEYDLLIETPGLERKILNQVTSGITNLRVELGPELYVKGQITGNLEFLSKNPEIAYDNPVNHQGYNYPNQKPLKVTIKDASGYFDIRNLWKGPLTILAANKRFTYDLNKPMDNAVLEIPKNSDIQSATRTVVFTFNLSPDSAMPTGSLKISYPKDPASKEQSVEDVYLPIKNGKAAVDIPVPGTINFFPDYVIGCWFEGKFENDVPAGTEPLEIPISAIPAGAVYGKITSPAATYEEKYGIDLIPVNLPPNMRAEMLLPNSVYFTGNDGFSYNSLPLGGTYVLVFSRKQSYYATKPFTLDSQNPVKEINITLPQGITLSGQLMDENHHPLSGIKIGLMYETPYNHSYQHSVLISDEKGMLKIENFNPDVPGKYSLYAESNKEWQPFRYIIEDSKKPIQIILKKGNILKGILIDKKTSLPIPNASVHAYSASPWMTYSAEKSTNDKGEFIFSNLCKEAVTLEVNRAVIPDSTIQYYANKDEPVLLKAEIPEGSSLKPAKPEN